MEEEIKELPIEDGVYTDTVICSDIIPEFTDEEADNREYEQTPENTKGGI